MSELQTSFGIGAGIGLIAGAINSILVNRIYNNENREARKRYMAGLLLSPLAVIIPEFGMGFTVGYETALNLGVAIMFSKNRLHN